MTTEKTGGLTLADLAGAGVDMRITKKELIDLLCEQARTDLEARVSEAEAKNKEIRKKIEKMKIELIDNHKKAFVEAAVESLSDAQKKALKRLQKDIKTLGHSTALGITNYCSIGLFLQSPSHGVVPIFTGHTYDLSLEDNINMVYRGAPNHNFSEEDLYKARESLPQLATLMTELQATCDEYQLLKWELDSFDSKSKQFRTKVMRELLGASESGKKVLDMLDSVRTTAAMHKQLESGE